MLPMIFTTEAQRSLRKAKFSESQFRILQYIFLFSDAKNRVPTVQNGSIVGTAFLPSARKKKIVIY